MMVHECLHSVHAWNLFEFGLERHGASVAFHRTESVYPEFGQGLRVYDLRYCTVIGHGFDAPGLVDGRKFELVPYPHAQDDQKHGDDSRKIFPEAGSVLLAYSDMKGSGRTCSHTFAAKGAVYGIQPAATEGIHIDTVRTVLVADTAMRTRTGSLDDIQYLIFRLPVQDFKQISDYAEKSQKHPPRDIRTQQVQHPPEPEEDDDPYPELEGIRNRPERTEIFAPEHVYEQTAENQQADGHYGHP